MVWVALMQILTWQPSATPDLGWLARHDKLAHGLYFGAFGILSYRAWRGKDGLSPVRAAYYAFGLTLLYGSADELKQAFFPHRFVEWSDWFANVAGACVPLLLPWLRREGPRR